MAWADVPETPITAERINKRFSIACFLFDEKQAAIIESRGDKNVKVLLQKYYSDTSNSQLDRRGVSGLTLVRKIAGWQSVGLRGADSGSGKNTGELAAHAGFALDV